MLKESVFTSFIEVVNTRCFVFVPNRHLVKIYTGENGLGQGNHLAVRVRKIKRELPLNEEALFIKLIRKKLLLARSVSTSSAVTDGVRINNFFSEIATSDVG